MYLPLPTLAADGNKALIIYIIRMYVCMSLKFISKGQVKGRQWLSAQHVRDRPLESRALVPQGVGIFLATIKWPANTHMLP